jgi:hypothetical protein
MIKATIEAEVMNKIQSNSPSPGEKFYGIICQKVVKLDTPDRSGLVVSVPLFQGGAIDV